VVSALTATGRLETATMPPSKRSSVAPTTTPHETWRRCYHRFRYARHYHDPADPDCSWTWTQVQIAAEILQRLIERRRP
jgi:hypothetical protein